MRRLKNGMGQNVLAKQRLATIPSKCSKSGAQGKRGQGFVLYTLILRVQRKQRTKNCSCDGVMRHFEKKLWQKLSCRLRIYHGRKRFQGFFSASSYEQLRAGRALFSLKAHFQRAEKKSLSAVFAKAALWIQREKKPVLSLFACLILSI